MELCHIGQVYVPHFHHENMSMKYIPPPPIPHFHITKLGSARAYLFLSFLLQNIDCKYSLEPPRRRVPTINVLSKTVKSITFFPMKFYFFISEKNLCILHAWASFRIVMCINAVCRRSRKLYRPRFQAEVSKVVDQR